MESPATIRKPADFAHYFTVVFVFVLPVLGAVAALRSVIIGAVEPVHILMFIVMFILTGSGITIGFHRLCTHRSFETHDSVKAFLLIFGSMAVEGPVIEWTANHIKHHTYSDRLGDPHTPNDGVFHSHWGWLLTPAVIETERYAAFLKRDRVAVWVGKYFLLWVTIGYVVPFLLAGWEGLIWGGFFRQFAVQNVTFAVNSVCHTMGSRPFRTGDLSTNNWFVGIFGLGEGWHNNHHAFPVSAFHGLRWWEFDFSGIVIRMLEQTGLAWNVKRPDIQQVERKLKSESSIGAYRTGCVSLIPTRTGA